MCVNFLMHILTRYLTRHYIADIVVDFTERVTAMTTNKLVAVSWDHDSSDAILATK